MKCKIAQVFSDLREGKISISQAEILISGIFDGLKSLYCSEDGRCESQCEQCKSNDQKDCPICGEKMNGIVLTHYKCKKCNEYYTN